jgi:hypothetical protein
MPEFRRMASPPTWMSVFVDHVTSCLQPHDDLAPLGCHFQQFNGVWEITLFASRTESIGGPRDGKLRNSHFSVDVKHLLDAFSSVDAIAWQAHRIDLNDELGPHMSVEGTVADKSVWLRVTSTAPARFGTGRHYFINKQSMKDLW